MLRCFQKSLFSFRGGSKLLRRQNRSLPIFSFIVGSVLLFGACTGRFGQPSFAQLPLEQECDKSKNPPDCSVVLHFSLSKDEKKLLSVQRDHSARLWDLETNTLIGSFGNQPVFDAQYTADDTSIIALTRSNVQIWDVKDARLTLEIPLYDPNGKLLPTAFEPTHFQFVGEHQVIAFSASSPYPDLSAPYFAGFDIVKGTRLWELLGQKSPILLANGSRLLTIGTTGPSITLWAISPGIPPQKIVNFGGAEEQEMFLSPDEKIIVSFAIPSDGKGSLMQRWNAENGALLNQQPLDMIYFPRLAISPDSTRLIVSGFTDASRKSSKSALWDANLLFQSGQISEINTFQGNTLNTVILFSPNSHRIFANVRESGSDFVIAGPIWDATTGDQKATLYRCGGEIIYDGPETAIFSSDGRRIYMRGTGCSDFDIHIWDLTEV